MTHSLYESRCKTCNSEYREEIEKMRLEENKSFNEISEWLEKEHQEKIYPQSLSTHFQKHVMKNLEEAREAEVRNRDIAESEANEVLDLVDELKGSISILKKMLNRMLNRESIGSSEVNAITKCLTETRLTVKELNNLTGELEIGGMREEDEREEFFSKFIDKVPDEVARRVLNAWEETEDELRDGEE